MDIASLPITSLKGVGPKLAEKLERLGLNTVQDVLFHLPLRYQDRTRLVPVGALKSGMEALVAGRVELSDVSFRGKRSLLCRISDGTGHLHLRFFYFNATQRAALQPGVLLRCFGEVRFGPAGLEMVHPEYTLMGDTAPQPERALTPVYPATTGLHQMSLRKITGQALERYIDRIPEYLPVTVLDELHLPNLREALLRVHRPKPDHGGAKAIDHQEPAVLRLAFEELLAHHLSRRRLRMRMQSHAAPTLAPSGELLGRLTAALPFRFTTAQQRVLAEIKSDLARNHPMQRLLQGDVGSGKTIVAAAASLLAVESGYQVAVLAPTELLAEQHQRNFTHWLAPLGIKVAALSGKLKASIRNKVLASTRAGETAIVIGTHALFEKDVRFAELGLVIVDEQHRFGVQQRLRLRDKGNRGDRRPHQLIMTATPIPRTLAQTLYADLDVSVIDEVPPGRKPVHTVALPARRRPDIVRRIREACAKGRQAYWVCPLIEESEALELQTATDTAATLAAALPELAVALIHGRMKPAEKEAIMVAFLDGRVQLLVATTVIEVGVDVPNASLMIIENAERLGLSQLHQLRGRVGRGGTASSCVLLYQPPLSTLARERLSTLRASNNGFEIARKDMEMRGPGEMLGTRQAGMQAFRIADVLRDARLLPSVQRTAELLYAGHPAQVDPIIQRWVNRAEEYAGV